LQTPGRRVQDGRLMIEPTYKGGPCIRNAGKGFDRKVASVKEK
jgi:hypothetical protein